MKIIKIATPRAVTLFTVDRITKIVADKEELSIRIFTDKQDSIIVFNTYEKMMDILGNMRSFMLDSHSNAELSIDCPWEATVDRNE